MNQMDFTADIRQIKRLFNSRIATADHSNLFVTVEKAIASGTGANALAHKCRLTFKAEILG